MTIEEREEAIRIQVARNKKNNRKWEMQGYKRYSRMIPARSFDAMDKTRDKETDQWESDCGR